MSDSCNLFLIYDGECGFCRRTLELFCRIDFKRRLRLVDKNNKVSVIEQFPTVSYADMDQAIYAVDARQYVFRGFFAFRRLIWNSPFTWPLLLLFYFPGAAFFGIRIYAWVAKNRMHMGCQSKVCELSNTSNKSDATMRNDQS